MDGILNLLKPVGPTAHDVVARVRRACRTRRVGHAGTLDPPAEGVLVVFLGIATRLIEFTADADKEYLAVAVFGRATTTLDAEGETTATADASGLTRERLEAALPSFTGAIWQVPPMFSAVHHQGERLYVLARRGEEVAREVRPVTVHVLELRDFTPGRTASARLRVVCSKGTYIRSLCADLGEALGLPAHLGALVRTRVGPFALGGSVRLEDLESAAAEGGPEGLQRRGLVLPAKTAVAHLPAVVVDGALAERVRHGNALLLAADAVAAAGAARIETPEGVLIGVGRVETEGEGWRLQPVKIIVPV